MKPVITLMVRNGDVVAFAGGKVVGVWVDSPTFQAAKIAIEAFKSINHIVRVKRISPDRSALVHETYWKSIKNPRPIARRLSGQYWNIFRKYEEFKGDKTQTA